MLDHSAWTVGQWVDAVSVSIMALACVWLTILTWRTRITMGDVLVPPIANMLVRFAGFFMVLALLFGSWAVANFVSPQLWRGDYLHAVMALVAVVTALLAISCTPLPQWMARMREQPETEPAEQ